MARRMLSAAATWLACCSTFSTWADEISTPIPATSSEIRIEVDAKRAQITGADTARTEATSNNQTILEAPVDTDDAPTVDE